MIQPSALAQFHGQKIQICGNGEWINCRLARYCHCDCYPPPHPQTRLLVQTHILFTFHVQLRISSHFPCFKASCFVVEPWSFEILADLFNFILPEKKISGILSEAILCDKI